MLKESTIEAYLKEYHVAWAITMPEGCPPTCINIPIEHPFYRLVLSADSITDDDFKSYAELNPEKDWGEMLPLATGLSVLSDETKARKSIKLPYMKQFKGVARLTLNSTDGVVKQTGVHKSHYTWWRTTSFDKSNISMLEL